MRLTRGITALVCAACAAVAALLSLYAPQPVWLDGLLFDGGLAVRAKLERNPAPAAHVAVVAVDPKSLDAPELAKLPRAFFGPVWGQLIGDLTGAGAKAIAFDMLFAYSASQFQKGYDRPFLESLYRNRSKVVLGRSARGNPARNFYAAMRNDPTALGTMDVEAAADEVHRSVRTVLTADDGSDYLSLTAAALLRAGAKEMPREVTLAPVGHPETIVPAYRLDDILRCAQTDPEALKKAFENRVIFVCTTLPEEDRKTASSRFITPSVAAKPTLSDSGLGHIPPSVPDANDIPGVFLHAMAAEAVLSQRLTAPAPPAVSAGVAAAAALFGAAISFALAPLLAVGAATLAALALWAGEVALLGHLTWLPAGLPILVLVGAAILAYLVRFVLEEGKRRHIQKAFGYYLAPALVDRMVETADDLQLGGETRDVTIMFADLSGFTALSGLVGPEELVSRTNAYLTLIADEVEATGGYVDKFIGDAVMAVWGAPVALDDHAGQAVTAAIRISDRIAEEHARATAAGEHGFAVKIGVNSGDAVVGNVGSEKRFNYTAVGEAVNIADRLEGLPGVYDCRVILGETTADRVRDRFSLRELDSVAVKGKAEPLTNFEPLTGSPADSISEYAEALNLYRNQSFTEAAAIWKKIKDGPSTVMADRAQHFQDAPPGDAWDGVWVMTTK